MKKIINASVFEGLIGFGVILVAGVIFFIYEISFVVLVALLFGVLYLKYYRKKQDISYTNIIFLFTLTFATLIVSHAVQLNIYAVSLVGFSILITVLFDDLEFSFVYSFLACLAACFIYNEGLATFTSLFLASLTGAFLSTNVRKRIKIIRAGFIAGCVEFLLGSLATRYTGYGLFFMFHTTLLNCLISAGLILGFLPLFEYLFRVITNISLLELSDFNHPLLRKMILEAPGTYQHSLVVANLAEAAAEEVGAKSLLARVGAYYHDIGKISKAEYFSENQMLAVQRDKHKKLNPSMSKLVITNHVKEGAEAARKYRLHRHIVDFILQHHGTTLVYYFFRMAQKEKPEDSNSEEQYRYPGPKPQSKEVAIVHLADTVEARSRCLEEPSPSRIREMVKESINQKLLDGQLDESGLTVNDLEKISSVFIRILNAMFHTRVDYPKQENDIHQDSPEDTSTHNQ